MEAGKSKRAILVYLKEGKYGTALTLDDGVLQPGQTDIWKRDVLYTSKAMSKVQLDKLEFSDKEMADFGYSIIARLHAFLKRDET